MTSLYGCPCDVVQRASNSRSSYDQEMIKKYNQSGVSPSSLPAVMNFRENNFNWYAMQPNDRSAYDIRMMQNYNRIGADEGQMSQLDQFNAGIRNTPPRNYRAQCLGKVCVEMRNERSQYDIDAMKQYNTDIMKEDCKKLFPA